MQQHNTGTVKELAIYRLSIAEGDIKGVKTLFEKIYGKGRCKM